MVIFLVWPGCHLKFLYKEFSQSHYMDIWYVVHDKNISQPYSEYVLLFSYLYAYITASSTRFLWNSIW